MKIKYKDLEILKLLIWDKGIPNALNAFKVCNAVELASLYEKGLFQDSDKVKDLQTRFVWDIFYFIPFPDRIEFTDSFYEYANDAHLLTALKYVLFNLQRKF